MKIALLIMILFTMCFPLKAQIDTNYNPAIAPLTRDPVATFEKENHNTSYTRWMVDIAHRGYIDILLGTKEDTAPDDPHGNEPVPYEGNHSIYGFIPYIGMLDGWYHNNYNPDLPFLENIEVDISQCYVGYVYEVKKYGVLTLNEEVVSDPDSRFGVLDQEVNLYTLDGIIIRKIKIADGIDNPIYKKYLSPSNRSKIILDTVIPGKSVGATNNLPWPGSAHLNDSSPITQTQLRVLATSAFTELQQMLPKPVMAQSNAIALRNLISNWNTKKEIQEKATHNNWSSNLSTKIHALLGRPNNANSGKVVHQSDLKDLAKKFYDILAIAHYKAGMELPPAGWKSGTYPWDSDAYPKKYRAKATIGEAKYLFSFDLNSSVGYNVPTWWGDYYGLTNRDINSEAPSGQSPGNAFSANSDPNDYYNGNLPRISIISGDKQQGPPGGLVPEALVVTVTDTNGKSLEFAPVIFSVKSGNGALITSSISMGTNEITAQTSGSRYNAGEAQVYFQLPAVKNSSNTVVCTVKSGSQTTNVIFHEYSDNGTNEYPSPFDPTDVHAFANDDGSVSVNWVNNCDPKDTNPITLRYMDQNGKWQVLGTAPAGATHLFIPGPGKKK